MRTLLPRAFAVFRRALLGVLRASLGRVVLALGALFLIVLGLRGRLGIPSRRPRRRGLGGCFWASLRELGVLGGECIRYS